MSTLRAVTKIILLAMITVLLLCMQFAWLALTLALPATPGQSPIVKLWHKAVLWILNIDTTLVNDRLLDDQQKIYLCNHISYIDIMVLGAKLNGFFVAKMDIAHWPVMGFLAKIGGTIFIVRERRHVRQQLDLLKHHLREGRSLVIFPEGTTGNGQDILPFKSSLIKSAYDADGLMVPVQPVGLLYTHLNGKKLLATFDFDKIAWYRDMTLGPHLWHLLKQSGISVKIVLHPVITPATDLDAKQLTFAAHQAISGIFN